MCGICGIIKCSQIDETDKKAVSLMLSRIKHRGPDNSNIFSNNNLIFGHNRLSIIDLKARSNQPFSYMNRYIAVFNGEIYNFIELKQTLMQKKYKFKTSSDTEVLLAAYDYWGINAFNHFNGMWALVIYDSHKKEIVLCRDRFGVKPLYYEIFNNSLYFASEIKALTALNSHSLDDAEVERYIQTGNPEQAGKTIVKNVKFLKPGHYGIIKLPYKDLEEFSWWDLLKEKIEIPNKVIARREMLYSLTNDAVSLRMRSDVDIGVMLSGGLDSSIITSLAAEKASKQNNLRVFSVVHPNSIFDESQFVDTMTEKFNQLEVNKIILSESNIISELDDISLSSDLPYNSPSQISIYKTYQAIHKKGIKVVLNGQGADELLSGYEVNTAAVDYFFNLNFNELLNTLRLKKTGFMSSGIYRYLYELLGYTAAYLRYDDHKFDDRTQEYCYRMVTHGSLQYILRLEDKLSMRFSIEARNPFLDYKLATFLFKLPFSDKINNGWTKKILRDTFSPYLPEQITHRKLKIGFPPKFEWFKDDKMLNYIEKSLKQSKIQSKYIERGLVNLKNLRVNLNWNNIMSVWKYYSLAAYKL